MATDRTGNEVNTFGIPTGPIEAEPTATRHDDGTFKDAADQEVILRDALLRAGGSNWESTTSGSCGGSRTWPTGRPSRR